MISRSSYAVCLLSIALTLAGLIRQHGPIRVHCPESRQLLVSPASNPPSSTVPIIPGLEVPSPAPPMATQATSLAVFLSRPTTKILRRTPKASRLPVGRKLANIFKSVVSRNEYTSWERLFHFSSRCLRLPQRGVQGGSLASLVNRQIEVEADLPDVTTNPSPKRGWNSFTDPVRSMAVQVSANLEEGDFKGAARIANSEDTLAPLDDTTFAALQDKHPPLHLNSAIPSLQEDFLPHPISVTAKDIMKAICSFSNGSAGGPDGLRPQHLKDMISPSGNSYGLLPALSRFVELAGGQNSCLLEAIFL